MARKSIILIGGGGHCTSVIDVIESGREFTIKGIIDKPENVGNKVFGYPVLGSDNDLDKLVNDYECFFVTIGQIKANNLRLQMFKKLINLEANIPAIISPRSYVSARAFIGKGTIIHHNAFINAGVKIGLNNIINSKAIIEHGTIIGNHNHLSTSVVINGNCTIGDNNFVGSNSTVINNLMIGCNNLIGAASVITKNVESNTKLMGNPAKIR